MKTLLALVALFPLVAFSAPTIGLLHGNTRTTIAVSGDVTVFCPVTPTAPSVAHYTCQDVLLEPSAYDYFQGPRGVKADEVTLLATHEDGSTRLKTEDYDDTLAQSTTITNLWISTLFQRPLLKSGSNKIAYTLVRNGTGVSQGEFEVLVQKGATRICPPTQYTSQESSDCKSPFSVCERYFSQYNNCTLNP